MRKMVDSRNKISNWIYYKFDKLSRRNSVISTRVLLRGCDTLLVEYVNISDHSLMNKTIDKN